MLNKSRLLTPGPTPLPEEVRLALARDMIHHRKPEFVRIMRETQEKLRLLFGTDTPVLPLACSGTGAMTAAVYSLFEPGQKVLVIETGKFGERWGEIAACRGLKVIRMKVEWGEAARPEAITAQLQAHPDVAGVLMQLCETSTGVLNPVREIAAIARRTTALLVVDGISAVGISPCPMAEWGLDCLLTGSQKGLMLPPGLALLALSPRAWETAAAIPPGCFYFNLVQERASLEKGQTAFTSPINLIAGLGSALDLLLANGLDAIYRKQWALAMLVRAGLTALGLDLLAKKDFAWGITAAQAPTGMDAQKLIDFCQEKFGITLAGGQDRLRGRIIRIGHMGWVDWGDCLAALCALACALESMGHEPERGYAEAAMKAYTAALRDYRG